MTQVFKGDEVELKMEAAGARATDLCSTSKNEFFDGCFEATDFLLALYDNGRMPFSDRVPRDSFVDFIKQQIPNSQFTGTFEAYLFILRSIFGETTQVLFDVPSPGTLDILVDAEASLGFGFQVREYVDGAFYFYDVVTMDGDTLEFVGLSGIDSQPELEQLLSELIPAGIFPEIVLTFFQLYSFVAEDSGGDFDSIIDHLGNQIVFFETGE